MVIFNHSFFYLVTDTKKRKTETHKQKKTQEAIQQKNNN